MNRPALLRASRLIVIDSRGRSLLFRHVRKNGEMFWATPGGGLEQDETFEDAACPVHQQECFFRVRGHLTSIRGDVEEIHRQENILEAKWWGLAELESSKEMIFPADVARKIRAFCQ